MPMIRFFKDHRLLGEYPSPPHFVDSAKDAPDLARPDADPHDVIVYKFTNRARVAVAVHKVGTWDGYGHILCGFMEDDPTCGRCHKKT